MPAFAVKEKQLHAGRVWVSLPAYLQSFLPEQREMNGTLCGCSSKRQSRNVLVPTASRDHPRIHGSPGHDGFTLIRVQISILIGTYFTDIHTCIHRYVHTHTYVHTSIHAGQADKQTDRQRRYVRTYLPTYLPTYIHTYIPTYLHTYMHTYVHRCIRA